MAESLEKFKTITARVGSISAGTDDERPIFVAPCGCQLKKAYIVNASDISADGTDFTAVELQDKGSDGSGTDTIVSFDTDSNNDNVSLTGFDAHDFGSLSNNSLAKGDVVTIKKTDSGSGKAFDEAFVELVYVEKGGLVGQTAVQ